MFLKYRLAAPSRIGSLKRYLMSGNRALAAGLRQEESFADEIERLRADAERHGGFMSGYLSFLHEGLVPASIALEVVDQALARSPVYWKHTQLTLDVVPGRGGMFPLDGPEGLRFLIRSRVFDDAEIGELRAAGRI